MYLYVKKQIIFMVGQITLEDRVKELKKLSLFKKQVIKRSKRDPLTLKRQSNIARGVGIGNVNLEFKRINRVKVKTKERDLFSLKKQEDILLAIPLIEPKVEPISSPFELDTSVDF